MRQRATVVIICVCVCVCVCVRAFVCACVTHIFGNIVHPTLQISFTQYALDFYKHDFSWKKLRSQILASFTYCDVNRCYCSDLLDSLMTEPSALLEKANNG